MEDLSQRLDKKIVSHTAGWGFSGWSFSLSPGMTTNTFSIVTVLQQLHRLGWVEKAVEKLTDNVTAMMDRLDARYPSRESVDLRFSALEQENTMLKAEVSELKQRVNRMSAWQYKAMGAVGIAAFASGLIWYVKHW